MGIVETAALSSGCRHTIGKSWLAAGADIAISFYIFSAAERWTAGKQARA
jgi:hypothetical protein